jgi:hypothetical protein
MSQIVPSLELLVVPVDDDADEDDDESPDEVLDEVLAVDDPVSSIGAVTPGVDPLEKPVAAPLLPQPARMTMNGSPRCRGTCTDTSLADPSTGVTAAGTWGTVPAKWSQITMAPRLRL